MTRKPPLQKNLTSDLDELDHAKKSCENVKILGWSLPPHAVVNIHNFFFKWILP